FTIHDKLLALSKSMGHRQIESTLAYYSLTPAISDIMEYTENQLLKLKTDEKED
ncbi:integrase, partial [Bacteroides fragilis]